MNFLNIGVSFSEEFMFFLGCARLVGKISLWLFQQGQRILRTTLDSLGFHEVRRMFSIGL